MLVVLLIAYYCGGYVAGRIARFNGIRQGFAVWIWTIVIAIVVAVVAGSQYDILGNLDAFPRIPVDGNIGAAGAIALGTAALASLVGALLGGLAGMRFHRKVDKASLVPTPRPAPPRRRCSLSSGSTWVENNVTDGIYSTFLLCENVSR